MRYVFSLLLAFTVSAHAEFLETVQYTNFTIDDPDGGASSASDFSLLNLAYRAPWGYDRVWYADFSYLPATRFDASGNSVGQDFEHWGIGGGVAWRYRATRDLKPWLGLGLRYFNGSFTKRHKVDREGFLTERLGDLDCACFDVVVSAVNTWDYSRRLGFGVNAELGVPLSSPVSWWSLGLVASYRWEGF